MRRYAALFTALLVSMMCLAGTVYAESPGKGKERPGHFMGASVHHSMYMQLLAEKYAPKTADGWKKAMEERAGLMKRLHEMRTTNQWDRDTAREKIKGFAENNREAFHEYRTQAEQLTKAVENQDEASIRETLSRLLQAEQKLNDALRKWLDKEQK